MLLVLSQWSLDSSCRDAALDCMWSLDSHRGAALDCMWSLSSHRGAAQDWMWSLDSHRGAVLDCLCGPLIPTGVLPWTVYVVS